MLPTVALYQPASTAEPIPTKAPWDITLHSVSKCVAYPLVSGSWAGKQKSLPVGSTLGDKWGLAIIRGNGRFRTQQPQEVSNRSLLLLRENFERNVTLFIFP